MPRNNLKLIENSNINDELVIEGAKEMVYDITIEELMQDLKNYFRNPKKIEVSPKLDRIFKLGEMIKIANKVNEE